MYVEPETNRKCPITVHFITVMLGKCILDKRGSSAFTTPIKFHCRKYQAEKEGSKGIETSGHDIFSERCPNLRTL
jgi:hypothetical protein